MNPARVIFEPEEVERVTRWRMVKYWGVSPDQWDALSYTDQCDALEIARADGEIERFDQAKARARANRRRS